MCPHSVGLLPNGSSIHSPISWAATDVSTIPGPNRCVVSKSIGEKVWIGEPTASWNPRTQHLLRFLGTPIDITVLYIKKTGNCEELNPSAASRLSKTGYMVSMLTIPSGPHDPKRPDGIARAWFTEKTR